jgi:hypothetical protein
MTSLSFEYKLRDPVTGVENNVSREEYYQTTFYPSRISATSKSNWPKVG